MAMTVQEGQRKPDKNFVISTEVHQLLHVMPTAAKPGAVRDQMDVTLDVLTPARKSAL